MKFKIGDRVKIRRGSPGWRPDRTGTIKTVQPNSDFPYGVCFNPRVTTICHYDCPYHENELELIGPPIGYQYLLFAD